VYFSLQPISRAGWVPAIARKNDRRRPWQWPFVLGFTVRGIVSLAAAFGLHSQSLDGGHSDREFDSVFLTFSVILVTLVGRGFNVAAVIPRCGSSAANAVNGSSRARRTEERLTPTRHRFPL